MNWNLEYLPEAEKDLKELDGSQRVLVLKAIRKVRQNPLSADSNGFAVEITSSPCRSVEKTTFICIF